MGKISSSTSQIQALFFSATSIHSYIHHKDLCRQHHSWLYDQLSTSADCTNHLIKHTYAALLGSSATSSEQNKTWLADHSGADDTDSEC